MVSLNKGILITVASFNSTEAGALATGAASTEAEGAVAVSTGVADSFKKC